MKWGTETEVIQVPCTQWFAVQQGTRRVASYKHSKRGAMGFCAGRQSDQL